MKNPFKVNRNGGAVARQTDGHGAVDGKYSKSPSVESQPVSPNTLAKAPRIRGAVGVPSVCPYCAVGCGQMVYVKGGKIVDIEGNYESPINEGTLCPKGANTFQLTVNPHRVTKVLYRAPFATSWRAIPLDEAMEMVARRVKKTRDETYVVRDERGRALRRTLGIAHLGGATLDNEENYLIKKLYTGLGIVQVENQARI